MIYASMILGKLILGQGAAPLDFNGLGIYGPLGFFVLFLIWLKWRDDEKYDKLLEQFNKYMGEERKELLTKLEKATAVIERLEKKLEK